MKKCHLINTVLLLAMTSSAYSGQICGKEGCFQTATPTPSLSPSPSSSSFAGSAATVPVSPPPRTPSTGVSAPNVATPGTPVVPHVYFDLPRRNSY